MRTKMVILLVASAGLLLGSALSAAAQTASTTDTATPSASEPRSGDWREQAMRARAQAPDDAPVPGRLHTLGNRADSARFDENVGGGDLGKDQGEGGDKEKE